MRVRRVVPLLIACSLLAVAPCGVPAQERGAVALGELIAGLDVSARVLMVGAHPDDEDTQLIAWLARGRQVEVAYLSLTRGDGGQNLIGNELGEALGVVRTEELLAARRLDGGRQYFTRAYDFGFSKTAEETFRHWPREELLRDVVTVVRAFRPHVIIPVFSGTPRDGHGHHQVSGLLAREAYDAAADSVRFPRAATANHGPWTPLKLYQAAWFSRDSATVMFNVGEYSALRGRSYAELAAESRSQHKSQGFGSLERRGVVMDYARRLHTRVPAPDDPRAERSLFDGMDPTIGRIRPLLGTDDRRALLDSLLAAIAAVRAEARVSQPTTALAPLRRVTAAMTRLESGMPGATVATTATSTAGTASAAGASGTAEDLEVAEVLRTAGARAAAATAAALGLRLEATVARDVAAVGDTVTVTVALYNNGPAPVQVSHVSAGGRAVKPAASEPGSVVLPDSTGRWTLTLRGDSVSAPWWLASPRRGDLFSTPTIALDETTFRQISADARVTVEGVRYHLSAPVVNRIADPVRGEVNRPLAVAPAVSVTLDRTVEYARASAPLQRAVRVMLRSGRPDTIAVTVTLRAPEGVRVDSASRTEVLAGMGGRALTFNLTGRLRPGQHTVSAAATVDGERFTTGYVPVEYDHIRPQKLYRDAATRLEAVGVALPGQPNIAYLPGVSDNVAPMLEQLGVRVTTLDAAALPTVNLSRFSAVVVGPRAYEARSEMVEHNGRLLDYVRNGGTLVVQYGQHEMMTPGIMPYPITLERRADRVTVEEAPVRIVDADSPLLHAPNRITPEDFEGWVQERALYMPRTFDQHYRAPLEMNDPGEPSNRGALLVASYGRGVYVYTTLSFFRQLPAGVPGAARLFANLLGAGANGAAPRAAP